MRLQREVKSLTLDTHKTVFQIMKKLKVPRDGVLLVHSSFKELSSAGYDVENFLSTLVEYMAPGTLLMPTMSWRAVNPNNPFFDELNTPSITGILSETFRQKFASHRSLHPTHSVAGCGRLVEAMLSNHHLDDTPCSKNSPFGLLAPNNGHVLLIGVGLERCTLIHHVEEIIVPDLYLRPPQAREGYVCLDRYGKEVKVFTRRHYRLERDFGQFEDLLFADGRLQIQQLAAVSFKEFAAKDLVQLVSEKLQRNPEIIFASGCSEKRVDQLKKETCSSSQGSVDLRPFNFVVVFWGRKFRDFFLSLCLPSLLSPNNVPLLKNIKRGRLIICSTKEDWEAIQASALVDEMKEFLELVFLDIGFPAKEDLPQLHMSKGHKVGIQWIWKKGEYGIFLAPDLVISDGSIARIIELAQDGKKAVLAVALRYDMDKCIKEFQVRGLFKPNEPLILPPRILADIAATSLHSEIQRFNWDSPYFCNYPISVFFPVPNETGIVVNSCSWAMVLVDFMELKQLKDHSLDDNTIDAHFIYQNLYHLRNAGEMHLITDSDEMLFVSLTSESDMSMYPLQQDRINSIPILGKLKKLAAVNFVLHSKVMDPFKRWAFQKSAVIHGGDLYGNWENVKKRSQMLAKVSVGRLRICGLLLGMLAPFIHGLYRIFIQVKESIDRRLADSPEPKGFFAKVYRRAVVFPHVCLTAAVKRIMKKKGFKEFISRNPRINNRLRKFNIFLKISVD